MYVKDKMSKKLQVITPDTAISKALDVMQENGYHRLPVVDENGLFVGLLTRGSIKRDSDSSSLSVFELNYLLNKLKAKELMIKKEDVYTINQDALLEEAATFLLENKVGCLPVLDEGKVVGIITQNDIFEAFIDILGYHRKGTRYVIGIDEDRVGVLNQISKCFTDADISISNLAVYNTTRGIEVVVIAVGDNSGDCVERLVEAGYNVTSIMRLKG